MAAFAVAHVFGNPKEMKPVVIAGKVINSNAQTPRVIKFNFCNPLIKGSRSVKLNEANEFVAREDMLYTQNMTVHYLNYFINLYVKPGDSVHLTIDASLINKDNFAWLTIEGDNAAISRQLNLCVNYLYKLSFPAINLSLPPDAMLAAVKQDYERYLVALNEYAAKNKFDSIVVNWVKKDLKYLVSNSIGEYGGRGKWSAAEKQARIKIFTDPFFDTYNPDNFQSMMFPYHLRCYSSAVRNADSTATSALDKHRPVDAIRKISALLLKEPVGECRDYMLFDHLSSFATNTLGILDSLKDINTYFTKAIYYESLLKVAETITKPVFPIMPVRGISFLTGKNESLPISETDVFSYLSTKYLGKVLYIDVYATWCGPCLEEMKYAPALYQSMKGKDVVFVNLCLASDPVRWRQLVNDKNIRGENYFFTGDATKLFMGTYKLQGYPSYILVNKQGQITTTNAPRPSDSAMLNERITKLLNEQ